MNLMYKITRLLVLLFCCFALLTACSANAARSDLVAIADVLTKEGFSGELQKDLQDKIKYANSDDEIISVLKYFSDKLNTTQQKLRNLKMRNNEVNKARNDLADSLESMSNIIEKITQTDLHDSAQLEKIKQEMNEEEKKLQNATQQILQISQKYRVRNMENYVNGKK
ncbi:MAG: hypothetical protein IK065_01835 [Neisseriaceae bacterium]|nr:hypothetical protein [Neisseriaceae bacterium]